MGQNALRDCYQKEVYMLWMLRFFCSIVRALYSHSELRHSSETLDNKYSTLYGKKRSLLTQPLLYLDTCHVLTAGGNWASLVMTVISPVWFIPHDLARQFFSPFFSSWIKFLIGLHLAIFLKSQSNISTPLIVRMSYLNNVISAYGWFIKQLNKRDKHIYDPSQTESKPPMTWCLSQASYFKSAFQAFTSSLNSSYIITF